MPTAFERFRNAWNAFRDNDYEKHNVAQYDAFMYSSRPDRPRFTRGNEQSIVNSIYNRIAMDVSAIEINHVRLDENNRYVSTIDSGLNNCLTLAANIDQTGRSLIQDVVMSMFDEGVVAIVPVDTTSDPINQNSYDIVSMRTGRIVGWQPDAVRIDVYNDRIGRRQTITLPKKSVAIIENPLYSVMNEPNSTLKRLIRKLNLLDVVDEQSGSGKLDMIVQLPYAIKGEARRAQAEQHISDIEKQLNGSKYGIAYADATERITQLNRPLTNNLLEQVKYLTDMLYSQLGINEAVLAGTADEQSLLNYNNRTIEPIISAITDELKRKFLTKTAITQKQSVMFFRDPFKLVPIGHIADIADKFTRNEILTSNEMRQIVGYKPVRDDPNADKLRNSNISQPKSEIQQMLSNVPEAGEEQEIENQND